MRGLVPLFAIGLSGCAFVGGGDVDRAAQDGSTFLRQAFVEHRFDDAARGSASLDATGLRAIVDGAERELGTVIAARPMSSAPAIEHGGLYVWYRVEAKRASGNVGLLVSGDARRGYRVEKLHVDAKAAPERWPGRPFAAALM
jgi:hypothetical protein